jgi:hypothetical protein
MEALVVLGQLTGVLIGGGLTWWGFWLRERKERKSALGVALADLLEVRHELVTMEFLIRKIQNAAGGDVSEEAMPALRSFLESFIARSTEIDAQYDRAISFLARVDPLMAFELRSKNRFPHYLKSSRQMLVEQGMDLRDLNHIETEVRKIAVPLHDKAVEALARTYSRKVGRDVREYLQAQPVLPQEFENLLKKFSPIGRRNDPGKET